MNAPKWIFLVVVVVLVFLVWTVICALAEAKFFFEGWPVAEIKRGQDFYLIKVENPKPEGEVKMVEIIQTLDGRVVGYWFIKDNEAQVWIREAGQRYFARDPEIEKLLLARHTSKI